MAKVKRHGGPNPGARARKELEDLPLGKLLTVVISGNFERRTEGVAHAIAAVREFKCRMEASSPEEAAALKQAARCDVADTSAVEKTAEIESGKTRFNSAELAGAIAASNISKLGIWLAAATSDDLRRVARLLECRPIGHQVRLGGNLGLPPADPAAFGASMALELTPPGHINDAITPEGIRRVLQEASPEQIEGLRTRHCPHVDASTFRKVLNQLYGVKRAAGARKR